MDKIKLTKMDEIKLTKMDEIKLTKMEKLKVFLFFVLSNIFSSYMVTAIYGFAAALDYHIDYRFLHLLEFYSLILILAVLLVGLPLVLITNFLKIKNKLILYSSILLPIFVVVVQPLLLGRARVIYFELFLGTAVVITPIYIGSLLLAKYKGTSQ